MARGAGGAGNGAENAVEAAGGPLGWWGKSSRIYPHIATLARMYNAAQASSTASERAFSVGGLVVTKKRNRLGGERVGDVISFVKA